MQKSDRAGESLVQRTKSTGLEVACDESHALPGEGAVAAEALVRLLGPRRASRPQAAQPVEAEVVDDLEPAAGLDENQLRQSRMARLLLPPTIAAASPPDCSI